MLLMVKKGIRAGICQTVHQYVKPNNKYIKNYDEKKESSYLKNWDVNNLHEQAMSQELPVDGFQWVENAS